MATYIKTIKQNEDIIYPITSSEAIVDSIPRSGLEQNVITASLGTTGADTNIAANTVIQATAVYSQVGDGFSVSGGYVVVGPGISKVLVSASVFYAPRGSNSYGWYQLEKNGSEIAGCRAIASIYGNSFGTATLAEKLISVTEGDTIGLRNIDASTYRQLHSYITVRQVL